MRYNSTQDRTQRSQQLPRAGTADDYKVDCSCRWLLSALRYTEVTCHVSRGPAAGRRCAEPRHYQGTSRPHAPHSTCTALHEHQESSVEQPDVDNQTKAYITSSDNLYPACPQVCIQSQYSQSTFPKSQINMITGSYTNLMEVENT